MELRTGERILTACWACLSLNSEAIAVVGTSGPRGIGLEAGRGCAKLGADMVGRHLLRPGTAPERTPRTCHASTGPTREHITDLGHIGWLHRVRHSPQPTPPFPFVLSPNSPFDPSTFHSSPFPTR